MINSFPGVGHKYIVDFVKFRVELLFVSDSSLTYTNIADDGTPTGNETVNIHVEPIGDDLYLVTWQEADKTSVVHVEDFKNKTIVTNITNPDLTFQQFHGTFTEMSVAKALNYGHDIFPLFRDKDVACMNPKFVHLRDATWMCVPDNAALVYSRLSDKTMPKDGPWPPDRIALFKEWMDQGCKP